MSKKRYKINLRCPMCGKKVKRTPFIRDEVTGRIWHLRHYAAEVCLRSGRAQLLGRAVRV